MKQFKLVRNFLKPACFYEAHVSTGLFFFFVIHCDHESELHVILPVSFRRKNTMLLQRLRSEFSERVALILVLFCVLTCNYHCTQMLPIKIQSHGCIICGP